MSRPAVPNGFGTTAGGLPTEERDMSTGIDLDGVVAATRAPAGAPRETMDVRALGPPEPLAETLERLPERRRERPRPQPGVQWTTHRA